MNQESQKKTRIIHVDTLTRVEGEGRLLIKIKGLDVEEVKLNIFEPPRFFEALLRNRSLEEAPDITSRICGICPIAYQMSSVQAMERALQMQISPEVKDLRRLLYCGEWIESHVLHMIMLHAPDFLGVKDIIQMSKLYPQKVKDCLRLKKTGNALMGLLGGREIHPINVKIGGFYKFPSESELIPLLQDLLWAREAMVELLQWFATFRFPEYHQKCELVALVHPKEYPMNEGRIKSNRGLDIAVQDYEQYFQEEQRPHSTALYSTLRAKENANRTSYAVGPLARYTLNFDKLSDFVKEQALKIGLGQTCDNPFKSILIRGIEVLQSLEEALVIVDRYRRPPLNFHQNPIQYQLSPTIGHGATEAPRGLLYHRYNIGEKGKILEAKIIPPTSQNQSIIEEDLLELTKSHLLKKNQENWERPQVEIESLQNQDEELRRLCEWAIRNYDPCISCATHFLNIRVERL